jgi:hypothetical protein
VKFSECYRGSGVPPLFRSTSGGTPLLPSNELRKGDAWKYNDDFGTCIGSAHRRSNAAATPLQRRSNAAATPLAVAPYTQTSASVVSAAGQRG